MFTQFFRFELKLKSWKSWTIINLWISQYALDHTISIRYTLYHLPERVYTILSQTIVTNRLWKLKYNLMESFLLDHDFSTHVWDYDKNKLKIMIQNIAREQELVCFVKSLWESNDFIWEMINLFCKLLV